MKLYDTKQNQSYAFSTSSAFDQIKSFINVISSINGHVQFGLFIQCSQWNAQTCCLVLGALRSRNADDVLQLPRFQFLSDSLYSIVCGGSSAKTNNHTGLDVIIHSLVPYL